MSSHHQDALEEAANWFATLQDDTSTDVDKKRWQQWLQAKPENQQAWQRIEQIDQQFHALPTQATKEALSAAEASRRKVIRGLLGFALAAPIGWIAIRHSRLRFINADIATSVGEVLKHTLPDGSLIWLNTDTAINLEFNTEQRNIILLQGEIFIETSPDTRSFVVNTSQGRISPIGTKFNVNLEQSKATVTVSSGRVSISPINNENIQHTISSGTSTEFNDVKIINSQPAISSHDSWRTGMLIADDIPLGYFLDQLSRYRHGFIRYSPDVAELKLVGAFPLEDTDRILDALVETLPIKITRLTPWWVSIERR